MVEKKIDIGITYLPIPRSGVEFTGVGKIKMAVYGLAKMELPANFEHWPFVAPTSMLEGTPSKVVGLDGWPDHKFKRNLKYKVTMMESALELCRQGLGLAYLPSFVVELHNQQVKAEFRLIEMKSPISKKDCFQSVYIVRRKGDSDNQDIQKIIKLLRQLA